MVRLIHSLFVKTTQQTCVHDYNRVVENKHLHMKLKPSRVFVGVRPLLVDESRMNDSHTDSSEQQQVFIAFARIFSGVVRRGQTLYVLGPKHDPCKLIGVVSFITKVFTCVVTIRYEMLS